MREIRIPSSLLSALQLALDEELQAGSLSYFAAAALAVSCTP